MSARIIRPQLYVASMDLIVFASSKAWALQAAGSGFLTSFTRAKRLRRLPPTESDATFTPIYHQADFAALRAIEDAFAMPTADEAVENDCPTTADFVAHGFAPKLEEPVPDYWLARGVYELPNRARPLETPGRPARLKTRT